MRQDHFALPVRAVPLLLGLVTLTGAVLPAVADGATIYLCYADDGSKQITDIEIQKKQCAELMDSTTTDIPTPQDPPNDRHWFSVLTTRKHSEYIDTANVVRTEDQALVWELSDYPDGQGTQARAHKFNFRSVLRIVEYNCTKRTSRQRRAYYFDAIGATGKFLSASSEHKVEYKKIPPGAKGDLLLETACML